MPSYFGPTLYTKGGGGGGGRGSSGAPTISSTLNCTKPKILQGIRYTLQDLKKHKVCNKSFVWLPWQLFDNMVLFANKCQNEYENRYFSNAPRNHKLEGVKIKLCAIIVIFMCFSKSNFEMGKSARFLEGTGGKIGLNVEKWSFSQGLSSEFSQIVPDT